MDQSRMTSVDIQKLTNKKKQYLQDAINDKNGSYSYLDDPVEYKKARKRLQNRESAVRSRFRKKTYQETLEKEINEQKEYIEALINSRKELQRENAALTSENQVLKQQVTYFQESFANSSIVGVGVPPAPQQKNDFIHKTDLDQFKAELF